MATGIRRRWAQLAVWALAASVLGVVFAAYRDPHTVVDLANRVWACF